MLRATTESATTTKEEWRLAGTIVCGATDSAEGRSAAQLAGALRARLGLRLVLVHVIDGVRPVGRRSSAARQRQSDAEHVLDAIARELDLDDGIETRVVLGDRAERLAQVAAEEGADLIVLGSRAQGLRSRQLRCALARELEAATPVPLLVAPPQTRLRSDRRLALAEASGAR